MLGPLFTEMAKQRGETVQDFVTTLLYRPITLNLPKHNISGYDAVRCVPGHCFDSASPLGPPSHNCDVVMIGKAPWQDEASKNRLLDNSSGVLLQRLLTKLDMTDARNWYVTNIVRFNPPGIEQKIKAAWVKECRPLLDLEIATLHPKALLLMGSDAVKAIFGKKTSLKRLRGSKTLQHNGIPVVVTTHPSTAVRDAHLIPGLEADLEILKARLGRREVKTTGKHYIEIDSTEKLAAVAAQLLHERQPYMAVDAEWGACGDVGDFSKGGKLRTIQLSHKPHHAFLIKLRSAGRDNMPYVFRGQPSDVSSILHTVLTHPDIAVGGHFLRSDLKYLCGHEIDADFRDDFTSRGFDTMLGYHVAEPQAEAFGLEEIAIRLTDLDRYDVELRDWLSANGYGKKMLRLYGYAAIPDDILHPYACRDVDAVSQIWPRVKYQLENTALNHPYTLGRHRIATLYDFYRHVVHGVTAALDEMEHVGLYTDTDRLNRLIETYSLKRAELEHELRSAIAWPEFNVRSTNQVVELLFPLMPGQRPQAPPDAKLLKYNPVKTTEKPPRDWQAVGTHEYDRVSPSTDGETLQILQERERQQDRKDILGLLHKLKLVDQQVKNFLRPPDDDTADELEYSGGLMFEVDADTYTRTTLGQLTDTGRYTSSKPNLNNLTKKQEGELRKIYSPDVAALEKMRGWQGIDVEVLKAEKLLHPDYYPLRSCYIAPPGEVLMEADYCQAELYVLAWMSQDTEMMTIMMDPNRDLHSEVAVSAFNLDCAPADVPKLYPMLRIAAKAVNFGIAYGRGANAIVRQLAAEGIVVTKEEAENMIAAFYRRFPMVRQYVQRCHDAVASPGYVETAYGRRRYFAPTKNRGVQAANEREAQNTPIQGTVADTLSIALQNMLAYRAVSGLHYRLALPVHDAIFTYVPENEVEVMKNVVYPVCMSYGAVIPNIDLRLEIDVVTMSRWGEKEK